MRRGAHAHDPISRIKSAKQIYTWINRAKIIVQELPDYDITLRKLTKFPRNPHDCECPQHHFTKHFIFHWKFIVLYLVAICIFSVRCIILGLTSSAKDQGNTFKDWPWCLCLSGWGQSDIFRTCPGEPVVRFFGRGPIFFRTSILERLVESDKTTSIYNVSTRVLSKK